MTVAYAVETEVVEHFQCFGGSCSVLVSGDSPSGFATDAVARARRRLQRWHRAFSRFEPASELSRLNSDPRRMVPVSPVMARFAESVVAVAAMTGGLVDGTLAAEVERAGYAEDFPGDPLPLAAVLKSVSARRPAAPSRAQGWRQIGVDRAASSVIRPPGLRLDSGGVAKGLFGDLLSLALAHHPAFAVDAAGDLRLGGRAEVPRPVQVACPFTASILHTFELASGAAATSGIGNRSWIGPDGLPAHHLLDPATGRPAFTGVVQATALAPSGVEAEARAKAAVLSGPARAGHWLRHGGLVVLDDGDVEIIEPSIERLAP